MSALTALIAGVAEDLAAARDELNRLDGVAGDGDLGITVAAGCAALQALLPEVADEEPAHTAATLWPGARAVGPVYLRDAGRDRTDSRRSTIHGAR